MAAPSPLKRGWGRADRKRVVRRPIRSLLLLCLGLAALCAPSAGAGTYAPPKGTVIHGGTGGYAAADIREFARLSGREPGVYQYFFTPEWTSPGGRSLNWQRGLLRESAAAGVRTMFHLSTARDGHGRATVSTGALARGAGDGYLIDLNRMIAESGQVVYVRFLAEMNNFNNPYSAVSGSGRRRGREHSTQAYRQAFRRAALILRGGPVAAINARLGRLRMPVLSTSAPELPQPQVALMWVPLTAGLPYVRGNSPGDYWPGSRYVDWVGTDFYANSPNFRMLNRLYGDRRWRDKPFVFGEYAVWGREDPGFMRDLFAWIGSHRRVGMAVYNQAAAKKPIFRLRSYPRTATELGRLLGAPRYVLRLAP
ncbi:MAG: hypothetical protein H0V50_05100 [Thermoleophilaceae bacterium]|nr:hypothetical protein [Thermoleophilaceae bacterium]